MACVSVSASVWGLILSVNEKRIEENGDAKRYLHDNRRVICTCNSMSWVCTNWNEIMWPLSLRIQWQLGNYIILLNGRRVYVIEKMQQKSCHASNFSSQCAIVCVCDVKYITVYKTLPISKEGKNTFRFPYSYFFKSHWTWNSIYQRQREISCHRWCRHKHTAQQAHIAQ